LRRLRYRPGRRLVAEVRAGDTRVIVKAYTRRAYRRAKHNATAFRAGGALRLAAMLGCSDTHRLIAFEWLPGRTLTESTHAPLERVGAALAALHAQQPDGLEVWTREAEVADLNAVAKGV